ncbi:MAG: hypothetical protein JST82_09955 [Bacteroidetes bacterium]|nr:hypothetical protein [Bacteroidota bacterium]
MINTKQQDERYTWLRMLDIIQLENIELKNQLAELVRNGIGSKTLEKAEYYQNEFLNKDTVVALLRRDVIRYSDADNSQQGKLRRDMDLMQKEFSRLKTEFNNYLIRK